MVQLDRSKHTDEYADAVAKVDAKDRAWRTFLQNIGIDILVVVGPLLYGAVSSWDGSFTRAYWIPVGLSVVKTAALVIISYVMRLRKEPKTVL